MPNFKKHATVGGVIGLVVLAGVNLIKQNKQQNDDPTYKFKLDEFLLMSFIGGSLGIIGGILPDILEPASSPNHRKFFHSATAAAGLTIGLVQVNKTELGQHEKQAITIAGVCYLSHLIMDSNTPFGLPLVA